MGVVSRKSKASTRPAAERVTFFTPGILPFAATRPAALFAPLLRRSACAKKGNQRNTPPVMRSPGILPYESARALRGSLDVHPCTFSERPRFVRGLLRTFPPRARRITWGPVSAASCRRSNRSHLSILRQVCGATNDNLDRVQGCTDSWINGAVRGAEHRRRGGKMPAGSRRWIAAIAKQYTDVLSEQPRRAEKRTAVRFARCESDRRVRCLAFLVTFWALRRRSGANSEAGGGAAKGRMPGVMPKSNPLARRASGSSALQDGEQKQCRIPACAGTTSKRVTTARAGRTQCAG
jgi:hypothetical protein